MRFGVGAVYCVADFEYATGFREGGTSIRTDFVCFLREGRFGVVSGGLSRVIFRSRTFKKPFRFCLCCKRWNISDSFSCRLLLSSERYLRVPSSESTEPSHGATATHVGATGRAYRTNSAKDRFSA